MMQAAFPLMKRILTSLGAKSVDASVLDEDDGVSALLSRAEEPKDDACTVLLPLTEMVPSLEALETQVGQDRNFIVVNSQWKRRSDFGFSQNKEQIKYMEKIAPTFYCSNLMVEGEQVRILRCYAGPWRVFLKQETQGGNVDWVQIGAKEVEDTKTSKWEKDPTTKVMAVDSMTMDNQIMEKLNN